MKKIRSKYWITEPVLTKYDLAIGYSLNLSSYVSCNKVVSEFDEALKIGMVTSYVDKFYISIILYKSS